MVGTPVLYELLSLNPFPFTETHVGQNLYTFYYYIDHVFKHLSTCTHFSFRSGYSVGQDQVITALAFNYNHNIYYDMDAQ